MMSVRSWYHQKVIPKLWFFHCSNICNAMLWQLKWKWVIIFVWVFKSYERLCGGNWTAYDKSSSWKNMSNKLKNNTHHWNGLQKMGAVGEYFNKFAGQNSNWTLAVDKMNNPLWWQPLVLSFSNTLLAWNYPNMYYNCFFLKHTWTLCPFQKWRPQMMLASNYRHFHAFLSSAHCPGGGNLYLQLALPVFVCACEPVVIVDLWYGKSCNMF